MGRPYAADDRWYDDYATNGNPELHRQTAEDATLKPTRTPIHHGPVVDLGLESFTLPNGMALELDVVRHPGGAAVVAQNAAGQVCLLRQYRHAAGGWLWELPAGKREATEAPADTARRELAEEAGVTAGHWQALGSMLTTPGFCDERIHLFLARDLTPVPVQHQDNELIEIHWVALAQARSWIETGQLEDAKSIVGLLLATPQCELHQTPRG